MNLKSVSKEELLSKTETLVRDERRITTAVLWHLHEIDRRRLFAELGFSSLFEYCTSKLKYSEGSAQRRISSMRLLREIPEIEEKINSGVLSVSALSQAQTVFRQACLEKKAFGVEEKKELLQKLESKSQRECEKILAEVHPSQPLKSQERVLSATTTEIRFTADEVLYAKLSTVKSRLAHKLKGSANYTDLINLLANITLEATEPKSVKRTVTKPKQSVPTLAVGSSRFIPKQIKYEVWKKSEGQCSYVSPVSKQRCHSSYALEIDHQVPLALGGKTERENLRLLCRTHNQLAAIQSLGQKKMEIYLHKKN